MQSVKSLKKSVSRRERCSVTRERACSRGMKEFLKEKKVKYVWSVVREVGRLESDHLGAEMVLAVFVEADSLLPEGIMHAGSVAAIFFKRNSQKEM